MNIKTILITLVSTLLIAACSKDEPRRIKLADRDGGIEIQSKVATIRVAAEAKKRITLGMPCIHWIKSSIDEFGITLLPLTPDIAVESCQLPDNFHGDPADRIIVATARIENCQLLTRDKNILSYGKKKHLKAIKA